MSLLHTLWPFGRAGAGIGAAGSPPVPPATDTDGNTDAVATGTDGVAPGTDAVPIGIGARPTLPGCIVWILDTKTVEWQYPEGTAPVALPEEALQEFWLPGDATYHARALSAALVAWGYGGQDIYQPELVELYRVMCRRLRWEPGPWIKVAAELRRITKTKKKAPWCKFANGKSRRMYVYSIPLALPAQEPLIMPGLPGGPSLKHCRVPNFAEARRAA